MIIKTKMINSNLIALDPSQFKQLVELASMNEVIEVMDIQDDLPIESIMKLQESSASLDFLYNSKEDIYTVNDISHY
jgi:hypothetical protein